MHSGTQTTFVKNHSCDRPRLLIVPCDKSFCMYSYIDPHYFSFLWWHAGTRTHMRIYRHSKSVNCVNNCRLRVLINMSHQLFTVHCFTGKLETAGCCQRLLNPVSTLCAWYNMFNCLYMSVNVQSFANPGTIPLDY